ncbi:hypothetical protein CRG98_024001 [Punica granatum]|uniref:Integrase catalytic domain-containing protein n=1 Tax=Punica granatum TaxID=22663 RepID=A0A2I0JH68_PUNGR|nr:hypothetical protein CRG98_024001 [Punica granatum]
MGPSLKDLYDPIEGDSAKPKDKDDKAWEHTNRKTIGLIRLWIDNSIYHHVAQETNAKASWDKLTNLYARKTSQNKAFLVKKLVHLCYRDGDTCASFYVTPHRDFFSSYTIRDYGYMRMRNGQSCKIVGIGDVCLETELGYKLFLKKVRHIPEIRLNLISTDDHSRKIWAYPLRTKDQVTEIFKNFHVAVERETGMKLKCVRADNGGAYVGYAHEEFGYRLWDLDSRKIIKSRDVVFFEDQTIEDL